MDTELLAERWREATGELEPPAGFVNRVVRGGQRRRRRRIARRVAGVAAVMVLLAGGGFLVTGGPDLSPDPRLEQPTAGDLAGDPAFLDRAVQAWRDGIAISYNADRGIFDDPRGEPHVYWAGTTPAGPAAVVLQRFYLHPHGNLSSDDAFQYQTLVGLVGTDPVSQRFVLLTDQYRASGMNEPGYFQFGPGDRTVLLVQRDTPVFISTRPEYQPDGKVVRNWEQLLFTGGVAIAEIPAGDDPSDVRLLARTVRPEPADKSWDGYLLIEPASGYLKAVAGANDPGPAFSKGDFPWQQMGRWNLSPTGAGSRTSDVGPAIDFLRAVEEWGGVDMGLFTGPSTGGWSVVATLADGTVATVGELRTGTHPSRLFAVITASDGHVVDVVYGGEIDFTAALPVAVRLPAGQGWVLAAYQRPLQYRSTVDGQWIAAGESAALVPATAVQIEAGGSVVSLPPNHGG